MAIYYRKVFGIRPIYQTFCAVLGVAMCVCCTAIWTYAGTISLQTTAEARAVDGEFSLMVRVVNRGDEIAHKLVIYPEVQGLKLKQRSFNSLAAGKAISANWKQALPAWPPGTYTALVRVGFADAMGEPYTALSFSTFPYQQSSRSEIAVEGVSLELEDEAVLSITLKNQGPSEKRLSLRLVLPEEIRCPSPTKSVLLPGSSEVRERFALARVSARSGATYPVIVLARYLEGGMHHTAAAAVEVTIVDPVPFIRRHRGVLALITGLLLLTYLGLQFRGKNHESPSGQP